MRRHGEVRIAEKDSYEVLELAEGLLGLLLCVGIMLFLLFLAGGM